MVVRGFLRPLSRGATLRSSARYDSLRKGTEAITPGDCAVRYVPAPAAQLSLNQDKGCGMCTEL